MTKGKGGGRRAAPRPARKLAAKSKTVGLYGVMAKGRARTPKK